MKYAVFLNGEYPSLTEKHLEMLKDRILICADGGTNTAYKYNLMPKAIVGDLDSIKQEVKNYYALKGVDIKEYMAEKDYTDFQIALMYICNIKADMTGRFLKDEIDFYQNKDVLVFGATGGRIDMSISNLKMLEHNKNMKMISNTDEIIYYINKNHKIKGYKDKLFSIIPLTNIKGLELRGFKYELDKRDIDKSQALVSNIVDKDEADITFEKGEFLIVLEN